MGNRKQKSNFLGRRWLYPESVIQTSGFAFVVCVCFPTPTLLQLSNEFVSFLFVSVKNPIIFLSTTFFLSHSLCFFFFHFWKKLLEIIPIAKIFFQRISLLNNDVGNLPQMPKRHDNFFPSYCGLLCQYEARYTWVLAGRPRALVRRSIRNTLFSLASDFCSIALPPPNRRTLGGRLSGWVKSRCTRRGNFNFPLVYPNLAMWWWFWGLGGCRGARGGDKGGIWGDFVFLG